MGFFDRLFGNRGKKKNLGLPAPEKENLQGTDSVSVEEQVKKGETKIYSDTNENGNIKYDIKWDAEGKIIFVGTINSDITSEDLKWESPISLLEMKKQINSELQALQECKNPYELKQAKKHIVQKFKDMDSKYSHLTFSEGIWSYIERYGTKEIDDVNLSELPTQIDLSKLSKEKIKKYGEIANKRLMLLKSIQTPEDTMRPENRMALLASMKDKEERNPLEDAIIAAHRESIENGENLDEITVLKIVRQKEKKLKKKNEDGALYPACLKSEEGRISRIAARKIGEAMILKSSGDRNVMQENYKKIAYLEEEVKSIQGKFSPESLGATIMDFMKGRDIEEYIKEYRNKDLALIDEIVNNYSDTELKDKEEILAYLRARVASLGQVSYKGDDNDTKSLRYFIENTDFKHPDDTQTKNFLLLVARSEEKNLEQQYGPLIEEYKKNLSFKERLQQDTVVANRKHNQLEGEVIEPAAFKREEPDEGERIA